MSSKDGTRLEYVVYWPDDEQILALKEQLGHLQTAYLPDSVLEDAVFEQGVAYMQGKLSLEQALDEIEQHQAAVRQPAHAAGLLQLFGQVDLFLHIPAHGHRATEPFWPVLTEESTKCSRMAAASRS